MHDDLRALLDQIATVKAEGQGLVTGLSHAQLNWHPAPDRYSIGDCLAHLSDTVTKTLPAFDRAITLGRSRGLVGAGPVHYGWLARWLIRDMEPPPKRRMRSPRVLRTAMAERDARTLLAEFVEVRDQLARRVRDADGLDLRRVKVTSPASRLFRMSLGAYFAFVLAHERRHLWQARQVRQDAGFPA
jgi:DinB family protein